MKKVLFVLAIIAGFSFQAKAVEQQFPDQIYQVFNCSMVPNIPDLYLDVNVTEGGFTNIPQVNVTTIYNMGPANRKSYLVKKIFPQSESPKIVTYYSDVVKLKINLSSFQGQNKYSAQLELRQSNTTRKFNLLCKSSDVRPF